MFTGVLYIIIIKLDMSPDNDDWVQIEKEEADGACSYPTILAEAFTAARNTASNACAGAIAAAGATAHVVCTGAVAAAGATGNFVCTGTVAAAEGVIAHGPHVVKCIAACTLLAVAVSAAGVTGAANGMYEELRK